MATETKKTKKIKIDKSINIAELTSKYPQSIEVLMAFGLHCVGCFANAFDTIEQGAKIHGMDDEEVNELVKEINSVINNPNLMLD